MRLRHAALHSMIFSIALFQLARLPLAARQQPQPRPETASSSIAGIVVQLGTTLPIANVVVELTRVEGTTATPLSTGAADAFKRVFTDGRGNPTGLTPPPALAPEIQYGKTGDDGTFVFRNLKPGKYRLVATETSRAYFPAEFGQRDPEGRGLIFPLGEGEAMKNARLEMASTGTITGRIFDAEGEPVGHSDVMAVGVSYQGGRRGLIIRQQVLTDEQGNYRLYGLQPGTYYVAAKLEPGSTGRVFSFAPGWADGSYGSGAPIVARRILPSGDVIEETYGLVYYGGVAIPETARPIDLRPVSSFAGADIPLGAGRTQTHHIRGVLINGITGKPAAGYRVQAMPRQIGARLIIPYSSTDANGAFDLSGVVPGSYSVVSAYFRESLVQGQTATLFSSAYTTVEVGNTDFENLQLTAIPPLDLTGHVVIEGRPQSGNDPDLAKIRVSATRYPDVLLVPNDFGPVGGSGPPFGPLASLEGAVGANGNFLIQMAPGDYRLTVTGISSGTYVKSVRMSGTDILGDGLHIVKDSRDPIEIVVGADVGELDGAVIGGRNDPMPNVVVALVPDSPTLRRRPDFYRSTTTDASGRFAMTSIPAGDYKLFAWEFAETDVWQDAQWLQPYEPSGKSVRIGGGNKQETQITVMPGQR